jgi:hypothetical protein
MRLREQSLVAFPGFARLAQSRSRPDLAGRLTVADERKLEITCCRVWLVLRLGFRLCRG